MNCLCPPISFLHENSTTVRRHLTPLARLESQTDDNRRRWGCGEIGTLEHGWRECEMGHCWGGQVRTQPEGGSMQARKRGLPSNGPHQRPDFLDLFSETERQ